MRGLRAIERWLAPLENALVTAAIALLVLCAVLICLDVLLRYAFSRPLIGANELIEYALVYITFLGAAWAVPRGAHINVDVLLTNVSERVQKVLLLVSNIICLGVAVVLTIFGGWTTWTAYARHLFKPTLLEIPTWIILIIIPIGSLVLALRYLVEVLSTVEAIRTGTPLVQHEHGPSFD
jgi:C4-dicarboxylate transporter, DctQ subunit